MAIILLIIASFLLIVYGALLIYYRISFQQIKKITAPSDEVRIRTFISVIIPARNEENNIAKCLDALIAQNYPKDLFEILVVNDHSEDNTVEEVMKYTGNNVRLINLEEHIADKPINSYKKKAIEIAVFMAHGELLVTTDADCIAPALWLKTIASFYQEERPDLIAMPVSIVAAESFLSKFDALDFLTLQGITAAGVNIQHFSMANGANLAYTKAAFIDAGAFADIDQLASGDDMLLMEKIKKRGGKISYLLSRSVIVETKAAKSYGAFVNQRIRWASKSSAYSDKTIRIVLSLVYMFNMTLLLSGISLLFTTGGNLIEGLSGIIIWFIIITIKMFFELIFLYPVSIFFNKKKLLWYFPIMQPFHVLYVVLIGFLGLTSKYNWKGRMVR